MNSCRALAISPDSKTLFVENCKSVADPTAIQLWSLPDGQFTGQQLEGGGGFMQLIVPTQGNMIVGCGGTITLWALPSGKRIRVIDAVQNVHGIAISAALDILICREYSQRLKIFGLSNGSFIRVLPETADQCAITPDGRTLISCKGSVFFFWSLPNGDLIEKFSIGSNQLICSLAITLDGRILVLGSSDKTIKLLGLPDGQPIKVIAGHSQLVKSLAIGADDRTLFSGSADKTIRIWDIPEGEFRGLLNG
jgi:WD40 repeat protein